jgi:SAM-dependent methyltransferase
MDRAERERKAYDEGSVYERSHEIHMRFRHVFESPNTRRGDDLWEGLLRQAVPGKRVLELGCAEGDNCLKIAAFGATYVLGVDVSERFLARARPRAVPGHLDFANLDVNQPIEGQFDVIFGSSILHHLNWRTVLERLYEQTLAGGGGMVFREPLGAHPLIRAWWLIGKFAHTPDERPFCREDIRWLRRRFPTVTLFGVNYLSLPVAIVSSLLLSSADNVALRWCDRADQWLEAHCRWLVPQFRQAVMVIEKPLAD